MESETSKKMILVLTVLTVLISIFSTLLVMDALKKSESVRDKEDLSAYPEPFKPEVIVHEPVSVLNAYVSVEILERPDEEN